MTIRKNNNTALGKQRLREYYTAVFDSPQGREVLLDLSRKFFATKPMFSKDANVLFHREGSRFVLLHILDMLSIDNTQLIELIKKDQEKQYANRQALITRSGSV